MPIRGSFISPARRLRLGASVLSAAHAADTRLVAERLARFAREHRDYVAAQDDVTTGERRLRVARAQVVNGRADLDRALDALARALIANGARRLNPFAALGVPCASQLARLGVATTTKTVRRLVATVRRRRSIDERTSQAAAAVERATRTIEEATATVAAIEETLRAARALRDARSHAWHAAFTALRHAARAAAHEGAPHVHARLFPPPRRPRKRSSPR